MATDTTVIIGRHAIRADIPGRRESAYYKDITEGGVRLAETNLKKQILPIIDKAQNNVVVILVGCTEINRSLSTLSLYAERLGEIYKNDPRAYLVKPRSYRPIHIARHGRKTTNKKLIFLRPATLKHWSLCNVFHKKSGERTNFGQALFELTGHSKGMDTTIWLKSRGQLRFNGRIIMGPDPQRTAELMVADLISLIQTIRKYTAGRPLILVCSGHGKQLDALMIYLSNRAKVTHKGYLRIGAKKIRHNELALLKIKSEGAFHYRRRRYRLPIALTRKFLAPS